VHYGTCPSAGSSLAIPLASTASAADDYYNGGIIAVYAGTGAGQARYIPDYTGSSKTAAVDRAMGTTTDTTSKYVIIPFGGAATLAEMSAAYGGQQITGSLHAYNARPTRDQAMLFTERVLAALVQSGNNDLVKDVDGTTTIATLTNTPDATTPSSRLRTA
jgi:hypothetical protein